MQNLLFVAMQKKINLWCLGSAILCLLLTNTSTLCADEVIHWNNVLLNSIREERTPPPAASRKMAIAHIAIYDAVNSIAQTHEPYLFFMPAPADLPLDAAIAAAAHTALSATFPQFRATYDQELADSLNQIPDGPNEDVAVWLGQAAANAILVARSSDLDKAVPIGSPPAAGAGVWKPTPSAFAPYLLPGWSAMPTFAMRSPNQFNASGPPRLKSEQYARDFNRVKSIGRKVSLSRTADQTQIALFWADGPGTATPPGHWNEIAQQVAAEWGLPTVQNARLFALLNITLADAAIAAWNMKFEYYLWRPVTAIREADLDGNAKTQKDVSWEPLINTPPFPGYVSGHSTFSSSAATLLKLFFGTDKVAFTTSSDGLPGVSRPFHSFSDAAAEAGQSRIYGGIHFDFDDKDGQKAGKQLANYIFSQNLGIIEP